MKFIVKIIRTSITRAIYRQRVQAANAIRHELDSKDNEQHSSLHFLNTPAFKAVHGAFNYMAYFIASQYQTRGLVELSNTNVVAKN